MIPIKKKEQEDSKEVDKKAPILKDLITLLNINNFKKRAQVKRDFEFI